MECVAIIPARGSSKRLPRKNILSLNGWPILTYPIAVARDSGLFERVIVSTEDAEIGAVAHEAGADVLWRPSRLADDKSTVTDVCCHVLEVIAKEKPEPAAFCCVYPTAVMITVEDLRSSMDRLEGRPTVDAVMGVSRYPIHPYKAMQEVDGYLRPVWPDENNRKSQEFPRFLASNGTFYWCRVKPFYSERTFFVRRLLGYELPRERAVDIDTAEDFEWVRMIFERRMRP